MGSQKLTPINGWIRNITALSKQKRLRGCPTTQHHIKIFIDRIRKAHHRYPSLVSTVKFWKSTSIPLRVSRRLFHGILVTPLSITSPNPQQWVSLTLGLMLPRIAAPASHSKKSTSKMIPASCRILFPHFVWNGAMTRCSLVLALAVSSPPAHSGQVAALALQYLACSPSSSQGCQCRGHQLHPGSHPRPA